MFREYTGFMGATFSGDANFDEVAFNGDAQFTEAAFNTDAWFRKTKFNRCVSFQKSTFHGDTHFQRTVFKGDTDFHKSTFKNIGYFRETKFLNNAHFTRANAHNSLEFEDVEMRNVRLASMDFKHTHFIRCKWGYSWGWRIIQQLTENKGWEGLLRFARRITADEKDSSLSHAYLEEGYRRLKEKYKREGNQVDASAWHYSEKEMYRRTRWWRRYNPIGLTNLYKHSSGFGECPERAAFWLIVLALSVFILLWKDELNANSFHLPTSYAEAQSSFNLTLEYLLFMKPEFKPNIPWIKPTVTVISRLLIPIQAALFGMALRNKFRR